MTLTQTHQPHDEPLAMLLYSSQATHDFELPELGELVTRAQRRNRHMGVTGAIFYEGGRFLQWLEGPCQSLEILYDDIGHDGRHTDIQMIESGLTNARLFADWNMHLFRKRAPFEQGLHGLSPSAPSEEDEVVLHGIAAELCEGRDSLLLTLFAEKEHALCEEIALCDSVMRAYGRMWRQDLCTDLDIALGLSQLLTAFRKWRQGDLIRLPNVAARPLLVATMPGETHLIGASLAAERLASDGCNVTLEFPASDKALCREIARADYGGLALVTSGVFSRDHWAERLRDTVIAARSQLASDCRVVSCGRFGLSTPGIAQRTGFDACCCSANALPKLFRTAPPTRH